MRQPAEFSWLTELEVRVAYGDYPNQPPNEVFLLLIDSPDLQGRPWDDNGFVAEIEPLVWAESPDGTRYQVPYELSVRKGHFSWGADGATAGLFLYIAQHLVEGGLGVAGGAAAMAALKRLKHRVGRGERDERFLRTREELESYGRWSIQSAYRDWLQDDEPLALVSESLSDDEWTGTFRDEADNEYCVMLRPMEGAPYRVRISRTEPSGGESPA